MNFVPYQWRADGGYQPSPGSMPQLFCPPNLAFKEPLAFVPGPLPVHGVVSAPTPGCPGLCPIRVPKILKGLIRPKDNDDDNNKKKRKSSDKDEPGDNPDINPDYPPTLRPGINYMFPKEHTILHIFNKASPIWEKKYRGQALYVIFASTFGVIRIKTDQRLISTIELSRSSRSPRHSPSPTSSSEWCAATQRKRSRGR